MKKIYIVIIITIIGITHAQAQASYCFNEVKTITTKWDNPNSPNTWNWTDNEPNTHLFDKRNRIYAKSNDIEYINGVPYIKPFFIDLP